MQLKLALLSSEIERLQNKCVKQAEESQRLND